MERNHKFTLMKEKPPKGYYVVRGETDKFQATTRPENVWPEVWAKIGKAVQKREEQEWANETPKLVDARRTRGISFIDPED